MRRLPSRKITLFQFVLVSGAGIISGIYIWRPIFEDLRLRKSKTLSSVSGSGKSISEVELSLDEK
jgi:hypothetical protein